MQLIRCSTWLHQSLNLWCWNKLVFKWISLRLLMTVTKLKNTLCDTAILKMTPEHAIVYQYRASSFSGSVRAGCLLLSPYFSCISGSDLFKLNFRLSLASERLFLKTSLVIIGQKAKRVRVLLISTKKDLWSFVSYQTQSVTRLVTRLLATTMPRVFFDIS